MAYGRAYINSDRAYINMISNDNDSNDSNDSDESSDNDGLSILVIKKNPIF